MYVYVCVCARPLGPLARACAHTQLPEKPHALTLPHTQKPTHHHHNHHHPPPQGGHVLVGAPTGTWQLIFVGRSKACPVTRNYLAAVDSAAADLDGLGVEVLAITADGRERAEAFVEDIKAVAGGGEPGFKMAYGLGADVAGSWGLYLSEGPAPGGGGWTGGGAYADGGAGGGLVHPEPATILLTPDGDVALVLKSSSAFGWADLRILVEGIRFMQQKGYRWWGVCCACVWSGVCGETRSLQAHHNHLTRPPPPQPPHTPPSTLLRLHVHGRYPIRGTCVFSFLPLLFFSLSCVDKALARSRLPWDFTDTPHAPPHIPHTQVRCRGMKE